MTDAATTQTTIGILGGGQLAAMLAEAATAMGARVRIFERHGVDAVDSLTDLTTHGNWQNQSDVLGFAGSCDVVTLENEFIPLATLEMIEQSGCALCPGSGTLRRIQDKLIQKQTLAAAGLPVAPFQAIDSADDLERAFETLGHRLVLKQRYLSYDGKGNRFLDHHESRDGIDIAPGRWYAEQRCAFDRELAVMVARKHNGEQVTYPVVETTQHQHICHTVIAPASVPPAVSEQVTALATRAADAVEMVGVMGVELFLMPDETVLINELAPRVHNSGHYTLGGCATSQFEQHIRAILGLPFGATDLVAPAAAMVNLLGDAEADGAPQPWTKPADTTAAVKLYGKRQCRPGRKMGHVTALGNDPQIALQQAQDVAQRITWKATA